MPLVPILGDAITDVTTVSPGKTNANPSTPNVTAPLQLDLFFRNTVQPRADAYNALAAAANHAVLYRSRMVFSGATRIDTAFFGPGSVSTDRTRWRFCFRSSPYCHALCVVALMGPPTAGYTNNTRTRFDVFSDATESTVVATRDLIYGAGPTGSTTAEGFPYVRAVYPFIDGISPNTDMYCSFTDVDYGRIFSAAVFELNSLTMNADGYLRTAFSNMTPVVDITRENLITISNNLWSNVGATVLTWSVNDGTAPVSRTSSTLANVLDTSVASVSSSSPGWTLDLQDKARASQTTGVPVVMRVFGSWTKGASVNSSGGTVALKNSAGTTVASITNGWSSSTPTWVSTTGTLAEAEDKFDLQVASDSGGGEFKIWAVSIWEQN